MMPFPTVRMHVLEHLGRSAVQSVGIGGDDTVLAVWQLIVHQLQMEACPNRQTGTMTTAR